MEETIKKIPVLTPRQQSMIEDLIVNVESLYAFARSPEGVRDDIENLLPLLTPRQQERVLNHLSAIDG